MDSVIDLILIIFSVVIVLVICFFIAFIVFKACKKRPNSMDSIRSNISTGFMFFSSFKIKNQIKSF